MIIHTIKTEWLDCQLKQNTYLLEKDEQCILIDAGCPLMNIKEFTDKKIMGVFLTHGHFDHIQYIMEYADRGIPIYCNKNTAKFFQNSNLNYSNVLKEEKIYKLERYHCVDDLDLINIGEFNVKCYTTFGHTDDSMSFLIDDNLFSGDTLFSITVGKYDLPTGKKEDLIKSLKKISNLNYKTLYAGHGRTSTKEEQHTNINRWLEYLK